MSPRAKARTRTGPPELARRACRQLCDWAPTRASRLGLPVFACTGCGSQWVRSEAWTPAQQDGSVLPAIAAEADRRRATG